VLGIFSSPIQDKREKSTKEMRIEYTFYPRFCNNNIRINKLDIEKDNKLGRFKEDYTIIAFNNYSIKIALLLDCFFQIILANIFLRKYVNCAL
jgi:hypothetical protein